MNGRQERELTKVEIEYAEAYERGDCPTLEELILRYPGPDTGELRAEIAKFVLDFVELENAARRVELNEEELEDARAVQERATRRCLGLHLGVRDATPQ